MSNCFLEYYLEQDPYTSMRKVTDVTDKYVFYIYSSSTQRATIEEPSCLRHAFAWLSELRFFAGTQMYILTNGESPTTTQQTPNEIDHPSHLHTFISKSCLRIKRASGKKNHILNNDTRFKTSIFDSGVQTRCRASIERRFCRRCSTHR